MLIADIRKAAGLTQKELAEISGVEQSNISKIERGEMQPMLDTARRIADALKKSVDEITWPVPKKSRKSGRRGPRRVS